MKEWLKFKSRVKPSVKLGIVFCLLLANACADNASLVLRGQDWLSVAPHGRGNVYAPEIVKHNNRYFLYYGAQAQDGHDRIHLATSTNGQDWQRQGMVFSVPNANHVNDPSVVIVNNRFYLFYTVAIQGIRDSIALAISHDGIQWQDQGVVINSGKPPAWDSLLVGRPSVMYENGKFRLWFDGRADLPPGAGDEQAPKSNHSQRFVGYAESSDGKNWIRHPKPVFDHDAGGIHVSKIKKRYVMLFESRQGTQWAVSGDGLNWQYQGVLLANDPQKAPYGHVTPFLWRLADDRYVLYFGAAHSSRWDNNSIMRDILAPNVFDEPSNIK